MDAAALAAHSLPAELALPASSPSSDAGCGWACPALLQDSFFLRACAQQALGLTSLGLEEEALPAVSAAAMAQTLSLLMPEPHPPCAELLAAGAALQCALQERQAQAHAASQQPLPPSPAAIFLAPYSPHLSALPLPCHLTLLLACDLAGLPAAVTGLAVASLAQRLASAPAADFQTLVAGPSPRCAALVQGWWKASFGSYGSSATSLLTQRSVGSCRDWALSPLPMDRGEAANLPPIGLGLEVGSAAVEELWVRGLEAGEAGEAGGGQSPPPRAALLALAFGQQAWLQRHCPTLVGVLATLAEAPSALPAQLPALLAALRAHTADAPTAAYCLRSLCHTALSAAGRSAISSAGGLTALVSAMGTQAANPEVCECACLALATQAEGEQDTEDCIAAGAAPAVVGALYKHLHCPAAAGAAVRACSRMAFRVGGMKALTKSSAAAAVVAALWVQGGGSSMVARFGCTAVMNLAQAEPGGAACLAAGAVPAVLAAMRAHPGDAEVSRAGCGSVWNLTVGEAGRAACVAAGAVAAVCEALAGVGGESAMVAQNGCVAVVNLSMTAELAAAACKAGAPAAVCAALRAHVGAVEVARYGCWALAYLVGAGGEGGKACLEAGAAEVVAAVLSAHPSNAPVFKQACFALQRLCSSNEGREACRAAGAVPILTEALVLHAKSEESVGKGLEAAAGLGAAEGGLAAAVLAVLREQWGKEASVKLCYRALLGGGGEGNLAVPAMMAGLAACKGGAAQPLEDCLWTLCGVALQGSGTREALLAAGAPAAVVEAVGEHADHLEVTRLGCSALWNIQEEEAGRGACVAAGTVQLAVGALRRHAGSAALAANCFGLLLNAACSEGGREACQAAGAVAALLPAMRAHAGGNALAAKTGCWALRNMGLGEGLRAECLAAGGVAAVVAALEEHKGKKEVVVYGCWALGSLGEGQGGRAACEAAGAPGAVALALEGQGDNPEALKKGLHALKVMLGRG